MGGGAVEAAPHHPIRRKERAAVTDVLTVDGLLSRAAQVAGKTHARFTRFTSLDDVTQEVRLYILGEGRPHLEKMLTAEGGEFRAMRALYGVARQFCEREKAVKSGYSFEDVAWYSPTKLVDLIPLALNTRWDGITGEGDETASFGSTDGREGGTLLAMVADIRRALGSSGGAWKVTDFDPETEYGQFNLEWLADRLGGEWPEAPGYGRGRRAISNAAARALTETGYAA